MRLTIDRLGHLGDGIAEGPLYVPRTLPGEIVELDGAAVRVLEPSADRVRPVCAHYGGCGGCSLMHASEAFVAEWKADVVRTALAAQAIEAEIRPVITSPPRSRRRAVLSGRRTRKGALVGFHARASHTVVEIPGCHLLRPELMAVLHPLRDMVVAGATRKGEIALTLTLTEGGVAVAATGGKSLDSTLFSELAAIAGKADLAQLAWDGEVVVTARPPKQRFGRAHVIPPAGAFVQATSEGEAALLNAVTEALGDAGRIADIFAGSGTFALPLAQWAEVHAVEGEADMLAALDAGWRQAEGVKRVTTETRDLFRRPLRADELKPYDAVVIDPPRAGAEAQMGELAASAVPVIASVSCNPVTFARDARILTEAGFRINWVQIVDQFRWSPHIEIAARFSRH